MPIRRLCEDLSNGHERLHIAPRPHDVDSDVQFWDVLVFPQHRLETGFIILVPLRQLFSQWQLPSCPFIQFLGESASFMVHVHVNPPI